MPLNCQVATAFRTTWPQSHAQASEVLRVLEDGEPTLVLLAAGSEGAFSTYWAPASRRLLNLFTDAWRDTSGPARQRLLGAFAAARERFAQIAPTLTTPDPIFDDVLPHATLIAAVIEESTAHIAWIGGAVGLLARGGKAIVQTTPHTLIEQYRRHHPYIKVTPDFANIIARSMSADPSAGGPPDVLTTKLAAGDTLILQSRAAFRGPCVSVEDAALMASRAPDASALASALADAGLVDNRSGYAAVAVVSRTSQGPTP